MCIYIVSYMNSRKKPNNKLSKQIPVISQKMEKRSSVFIAWGEASMIQLYISSPSNIKIFFFSFFSDRGAFGSPGKANLINPPDPGGVAPAVRAR